MHPSLHAPLAFRALWMPLVIARLIRSVLQSRTHAKYPSENIASIVKPVLFLRGNVWSGFEMRLAHTGRSRSFNPPSIVGKS